MNTIGKTLVILNFVFAVVIGSFLVLHFAVQTQWKDSYEKLVREFEILKKARITDQKIALALANDNRSLMDDIENRKKELAEETVKRSLVQTEMDVKIDELNGKLADAVRTNNESLKTIGRLTNEITELDKAVEVRQKLIVKLEADVKQSEVRAVTNKARAEALQIQNENLLEQNRDLTREITRMRSSVSAEAIAIGNPNQPNPPAVQVEGRIERVDPVDGTLVQISLGSDHGVNKNHTLDVYRVVPDAKYLGMIRIIESYQHKSVGRLVASGSAATRGPLRADDKVTSKITR